MLKRDKLGICCCMAAVVVLDRLDYKYGRQEGAVKRMMDDCLTSGIRNNK